MKTSFLFLMIVFSIYIFPGPVTAQEEGSVEEEVDDPSNEEIEGSSDGDWDIVLGALATYGPKYDGSDDYEFGARPVVDIVWRDRVYLNIRDGLGVYAYSDKTLRIGGGIGYAPGRDESDFEDLTGLGDVDAGAALIATAEYNFLGAVRIPGLSVGSRLEYQFTGGDTGLLFETDVGYRIPLTDDLSLRPSLGFSLASGDYMQSYFGVTAAQSAASGLSQYDASAGFRSVGSSLSMEYRITDHVSLRGGVFYDRLVGAAADSPIVKDANQFGAAIGLTYTF